MLNLHYRVFYEVAVELPSAAVADMHAEADTHVGGDGMPLRQDVLQVQVAGQVAPRNVAEVDRVVRVGVVHDSAQTLLVAPQGGGAQVRVEVREPEQHADFGRDERVVEPYATAQRAATVVAAERPEIDLDGAELMVHGGELDEVA